MPTLTSVQVYVLVLEGNKGIFKSLKLMYNFQVSCEYIFPQNTQFLLKQVENENAINMLPKKRQHRIDISYSAEIIYSK